MAVTSKYKAVRPFSVGGRHFDVGDPVDGRALLVVLDHGDEFVKADTARTRKESATTQTEES